MAFRRPFRIGDLIEVQGMRGRVKKCRSEKPILKLLMEKMFSFPNSIILKNHLKISRTINFLRSEFFINVDYSKI